VIHPLTEKQSVDTAKRLFVALRKGRPDLDGVALSAGAEVAASIFAAQQPQGDDIEGVIAHTVTLIGEVRPANQAGRRR